MAARTVARCLGPGRLGPPSIVAGVEAPARVSEAPAAPKAVTGPVVVTVVAPPGIATPGEQRQSAGLVGPERRASAMVARRPPATQLVTLDPVRERMSNVMTVAATTAAATTGAVTSAGATNVAAKTAVAMTGAVTSAGVTTADATTGVARRAHDPHTTRAGAERGAGSAVTTRAPSVRDLSRPRRAFLSQPLPRV